MPSFEARANAKPIFLTFDLEEFDLPADLCGIPMSEDDMYSIAYTGAKRAEALLGRTGVKTTFFTTTSFAKKYPALVRSLRRSGHEIAFHGYKHDHKYSRMARSEAYMYIRKGKEELEKIAGGEVVGFRSPWFFGLPPAKLRNLGFEYDSSTHPTWVPGHYFNFRDPRSMRVTGGITVLPISVTPGLRLPFSWIWFRNFGLDYAKACTQLCVLDQPYVNIYLHPWEFVDIAKRDDLAKLPLLIKRNTGKKMESMVESYIKWCKSAGFRPMTIKDWLSERGSSA